MKIAIVIEKVDTRGGQNRVIAELSRRLADRHEVHIYCFEAADVDERVTVHIMPCPLRHRPIVQEMWIPTVSRWRVKPSDFDIVMAQGGNCFVANATLSHISLRELAAAKEFALAGQEQIPGWERTIRTRWQRHAIGYEKRVVEACRGAVMTVSEQLRITLMEHYGLAEDEVTATPNGVDHDRFGLGVRDEYRDEKRAALGLDDGDFVALFMGARWLEKGLDRVLSALKHIERDDIHLLVVGKGDSAAIEHLIPVHHAHRVRFTGVQQPEPYFAAADCFVFPSRVEGFGLVMAEAAACGLPLIVTPAGVGAEIAEDGISGYLANQAHGPDAEAELSEQMGAHITHLADHPQDARRMGIAAHQRSLPFTWDRQAELIEGVFERVVGHRR
jgi:UDP-glucose:(heptosyl)LPS alpha-1,3-glucosyltransferase